MNFQKDRTLPESLSLTFIKSIALLLVLTSCSRKETSAPLIHYSFSGNTADEQVYSGSLENNGAGPSTDRFAHAESAYYFDGASASMKVKLNEMPSINSPLTISWWFKAETEPIFKDSMDAGNMIAIVDTTQAIGIQFGYRAPGYKTKGLDVWNWGGGTILESPKPAINQWHHCVYVYDGNEHRFFLDGNQISRSQMKPQSGSPNLLMIGNYPGGKQFFKGSMDEIQIYDHTLTADQIQELFKLK